MATSFVMRLAGYVALIVLSLGVAGYAVGVYGFLPLGAVLHPDMRAAFEAHRAAVYVHIFASAVALALGPLQFSTRLRSTRLRLHRWLGRLYVGVGVLGGGVAGLSMAFHAFGGLASRLGFACLALAWLYTGYRAYRAIRGGNVAAHRRWMVRNFALTFAAVTLRIWQPASVVAGIPFELAYPVIAWLCWLPNLLVAELVLKQPQDRFLHRTATGKPASAA
jgi:uncharacterized membrane protein